MSTKRPIENVLASVKLVFNATGWSRKREKLFIAGVNNIVSVIATSIGYQNCGFLATGFDYCGNSRRKVKRIGNELVITFGEETNLGPFLSQFTSDRNTVLSRLYENNDKGNDLMHKHSAAIADLFIRALKVKYEKNLKHISVGFHNFYCEREHKVSGPVTAPLFTVVGAKRKQARCAYNVPNINWYNRDFIK